MLKKLSKREKGILVSVTAVTIIGLCYNFLVEPLFMRWRSTNSRIELIKVKLKKSLSLIKEKRKVDAEYSTYEKKLKSKGSNEQDITLILDEIEKIASRSGLKITSMRPNPPDQKDYYSRFAVKIDTESDMNSLMRFIYDIKNSPQILKIEKLNINTRSSQQGVAIRASMLISRLVMK
jgi:Tfp pilus assembly protein PilO